MNVNDLEMFKDKCTACGACSAICRKKAISMVLNSEGFFYPEVNRSKCVECGLCIKVCQLTMNHKVLAGIEVLTGKALSDDVRKNSSSGGFFYVFAKYILKQNGVVFGVAFDGDTRKATYCSSDDTPIEKIMRSKYVEACDDKEVYNRTKKELDSGRLVLFCGTPCKIIGLKAFLRMEYSNLYTVDFMCHGKPSSGLLMDTIKREERISEDRCVDVTFREKIKGWRKQTIAFYFNNSDRIVYESKHYYYYYYFLHNYSLRKSCYTCSCYNKHESDVTLADYWAISKSIDDDVGYSLIFVNNEKGKKLIKNVGDDVDVTHKENETVQLGMYVHSKKKGYSLRKRKSFYNDYEKQGIDYIATKGYDKRVNSEHRKQAIISVILKIMHHN